MCRVLILALALTACTTTTHWAKPGASEDDWARDVYQCRRETMIPTGFGFGSAAGFYFDQSAEPDRGLLALCLRARGWRETDHTMTEWRAE